MSKNRTDRKRTRRLDAESRAASYAELTGVEKLARLPAGGAKRQRMRLLTRTVATAGVTATAMIGAIINV